VGDDLAAHAFARQRHASEQGTGLSELIAALEDVDAVLDIPQITRSAPEGHLSRSGPFEIGKSTLLVGQAGTQLIVNGSPAGEQGLECTAHHAGCAIRRTVPRRLPSRDSGIHRAPPTMAAEY